MKITEVQVERYGVWRQLHIPLSTAGVHVFYGPNEAGKTTLLRFIRGVLYGFNSLPEADGIAPLYPAAGALGISAEGRAWQLHRRAAGDGTSDVTLWSGENREPDTGRLESWFQGVGEQVFDDVFAIGLRELQQLATLSDDEAAQRIYGITLGPEGQRLLDISRRADADRNRLLNPKFSATQRPTGELLELFDEHDRLQARIESLRAQRDDYASLATERDQTEQEISNLKQRQSGIQHELRGHLLLQRAHVPWQRLQECERQLAELPDVREFPEEGLARLDKLDSDITVASRTRQTLIAEVQAWRKQGKITIDPEFRRQAAALHGLVAQRGLLDDLQQQQQTAQSHAEEADLSYESEREQLGGNWTTSKLAELDTSSEAYERLRHQADSLQATHRRRASIRTACKRLDASIRRRRELLDVRLRELGGSTTTEALATQRTRLEQLQQATQLRLCETELVERQAGIFEHRARMAPRTQLPTWVFGLLVMFGAFGCLLAVSGLVIGVRMGALAGAVYGLGGLTCLGLAAGLKRQYEVDSQSSVDALDAELQENITQLRNTRELIRRLVNPDAPATDATAPAADGSANEHADAGQDSLDSDLDLGEEPRKPEADSQIVIEDPEFRATSLKFPSMEGGTETGIEAQPRQKLTERLKVALLRLKARGVEFRERHWGRAVQRDERLAPAEAALLAATADEAGEAPPAELELVQQTMGRIAELQELGLLERRLRRAARQLRQLRTKRNIAGRELQTARESWKALLRQIKFPDTLKTAQALQLWQSLFDVADSRRKAEAARGEVEHLGRLTDSFQRRIQEQGQRLQDFQSDYSQPLKILDAWEQQLAELARQRQQRSDLYRQILARRREVRKFAKQIATLRAERGALLVLGGATSREQFEQRAAWFARRNELDRERSELILSLEAIQSDFEDIAIVEQDLQELDSEHNADAIETLKAESTSIEEDRELALEKLGGLKHELRSLEDDDQVLQLKFELAQVQSKLDAVGREWLAIETAGQAIDVVRRRFEREHQPEMLRTASGFLEKLTRGKYRSVWMPLGERVLRVDDEQSQSLAVECLSRGTRELLFLAVRLAVAKELAGRGIALPLILDDVVVNLDEERAEAALNLLWEFAHRGQQILFFTCHKHLVQQFANRGAQTIHLPGHANELASGQRLAG